MFQSSFLRCRICHAVSSGAWTLPKPLIPRTPFQFLPQPRHWAQRRTQYYGRRRASPQDLVTLWRQNPSFRLGVYGAGGAFGAFYVYNLEEVPITGRRRFNAMPEKWQERMAQQMFEQVMSQYGSRVLPAWHPSSRMVRRVLNRLIPAAGLQDADWEVFVIEDRGQKNAFVIPGGKVFVFSGILPICETDDGLAAVLGHEIAHNVAQHAAERMSSAYIMMIGIYALAFLFGTPDSIGSVLMDYGFMRPGSRKQEAEADYIGLLMMAQSCYDPEAAVGLWQRMEKAEQNAPPEFLSTHPSSHNRVTKIQQWLPIAEQKRAESDCASTLSYSNDFKKAFQQVGWT